MSNVTDKLSELVSLCNFGVYIKVNPHRDLYKTACDWVRDHQFMFSYCIDDIDPEVISEMMRTDTVVDIQFYPSTPVGFYRVIHHDLSEALDQAFIVSKEVCDVDWREG